MSQFNAVLLVIVLPLALPVAHEREWGKMNHMVDSIAFYTFATVSVICYTWYKYNTRNDPPRQ